ncbi:hypothetical protein PFISCL1PPCAC_26002, partial [Pristionchus fissidentatus]
PRILLVREPNPFHSEPVGSFARLEFVLIIRQPARGHNLRPSYVFDNLLNGVLWFLHLLLLLLPPLSSHWSGFLLNEQFVFLLLLIQLHFLLHLFSPASTTFFDPTDSQALCCPLRPLFSLSSS